MDMLSQSRNYVCPHSCDRLQSILHSWNFDTQCSVLSLHNTGLYELQNFCVKPTLLPVCALSSCVERQGDFPLSLLNDDAVSA